MKTQTDPRHARRQQIVKELFEWEATKKFQTPEHKAQITHHQNETTAKVIASIEEIDKLISESATKWPKEMINNSDIAIIRLAVYEILQKTEPTKVIIDEAIELGKEFGSESSPGFINGVLGSIITATTKENDKV